MTTASTTPEDDTPAAGVLCIALNAEEGQAPEWIELIPAGQDVVGFDGRRWTNPDPAAVVAATPVQRRALVLDYEHATQARGEQGLEAPAAAWINELQVREGGAIWGRAEWTARARAMVAGREYRFVSPVFAHTTDGRITRLLTAALTNFPNLALTALNRSGSTRETKETSLTLAQRLAAALGLDAASATDDAIVSAVETRAANRATPDLTSFAPRAELNAALNRATAAEAGLAEMKAAQREADIETALGAAQDAGKIIPASVETWRAMCREEGGLERFTALAATLPVIAGAAETRAAGKVEKAATGFGLTEEERAVCRALGQSEEEFSKAKGA